MNSTLVKRTFSARVFVSPVTFTQCWEASGHYPSQTSKLHVIWADSSVTTLLTKYTQTYICIYSKSSLLCIRARTFCLLLNQINWLVGVQGECGLLWHCAGRSGFPVGKPVPCLWLWLRVMGCRYRRFQSVPLFRVSQLMKKGEKRLKSVRADSGRMQGCWLLCIMWDHE